MSARPGPDTATQALVQPLAGAAFVLSATALFSLQDALIKYLADGYSLFQLLFIRALVGSAVLALVLRWRYGRGAFQTSRPWDHVLRAALNLAAFLCFYYAVTHMALASATAIVLSSPIIMSLLSGRITGEPASRRALGASALGFIGVVAIAQPDGANTDHLAAVAAVGGALSFAMLSLQNRRMSTTEASELMVFWGATSFIVVAGAMMPAYWRTPPLAELATMIALGLISTAAQFLIVHGFRHAPVFIIAPVEYSGLLWATLLGYLVFDEVPNALAVMGGVLVVIAGIYVVLERDSH